MNKAIVMGTGFGGLASAVRLLAKGYEVTLLEALKGAGGRAGVFREQGFIFDAGPTVITAPYLLNELFELLGENPKDYFELLPIDPFYQIMFHDGTIFNYGREEEELLENIRKISPQDVDGYRKLARRAKDIFDVGYVKLGDEPFSTLFPMLMAIPDMIRLKNYKSVYSLVSSYIKDPRLRQAFSFEPLLVGGNPIQVTSIYLLIHWLERKWGVYFVKGGTNALVSAFCKLLEKKGAKIHYESSVKEIKLRGNSVEGVVTTDEKFYPADVVVSNADPVRVYRDMIAPEKRKKHTNRSLERKHQSMSLFVAYFGTKKNYPDIKHHTIVLGPRYEGLLDDIFNKKKLADDFSLYLHAPTRTDQSMGPSNHETFYVLSPVPNNKSGINWKETEKVYKEKIYRELEKRCLPGLMENMVVDFHITPDYFENVLQSEQGAAFGIEPRFTQSAYFRFHNRSEDIPGLYFVGANTHPGAGLPGVLCSAKVLEKVLPKASMNLHQGIRV